MTTRISSLPKWIAMALLLAMFALSSPLLVAAQTDDLDEMKKKVAALIDELKYGEALPLLEKLVAAEPNNAESHYHLGFALISKATDTAEAATRRSLRVRAREAFVRAKRLGREDEAFLDALITSLPPDGSDAGAFTANAAAEAIMKSGEAHFSKGELDEALKNYQKALALDPKLYYAALFSGDVFLHKGNFEQAEVWYQKAISIDPDKETAYRYSATPFMRQGKYDEARDRYIQAYLAEPYNRFAISGITQWAQKTNTRLAHPRIDIPVTVTFKENGDVNINLDPATMGQDDGSFAWIGYGATRASWRKEKFAKAHPKETKYRHSLAEEADALRTVLHMATTDQRTKGLSPSLTRLKKLNDDGLLEAYLLLARVDEGMAQDYAAYLAANRAILRRYVTEYIMRGGGE